MTLPSVVRAERGGDDPRRLIDQAFTRAAGAPLVRGNSVRLLKDAAENYPAWLDAIRSAERTVHFESYIVHDDATGALFAQALAAKAREGVRVRLIYDWLGGVGKASRRFWRSLEAAGVEVRCFNPPRLTSPVGWLHRDHRKILSVDGRVGFVAGLCVGRMWAGDPARGIVPWRDTGVEIRGPAVADIERAFAYVWDVIGDPLPRGERVPRAAMPSAGDVAVRIVASTPGTAGLLRLDQLVAAAARETLWLADAYFAGTPSYVQSLRAAALDGVDVRVLVPGASDIPVLRPLSQAGFRPLLEAGVRVFEWKGPMMHAKTAVADGRWARVGSSNLNLASWIGNYELDAVVEDEGFAAAMQRMFEDDLANATEIVLSLTRRGRRVPRRAAERGVERGTERGTEPFGVRSGVRRRRRAGGVSSAGGGASRVAAGALRLGNTVGAAITDHRVLAPTEARIVAAVGALLLGVAVIAVRWPRVLTIPLALVGTWVALALLVKSFTLYRARRATRTPPTPREPAAEARVAAPATPSANGAGDAREADGVDDANEPIPVDRPERR
jgi:cardiolipin synthase A/B